LMGGWGYLWEAVLCLERMMLADQMEGRLRGQSTGTGAGLKGAIWARVTVQENP
jgi:hypothetical protein